MRGRLIVFAGLGGLALLLAAGHFLGLRREAQLRDSLVPVARDLLARQASPQIVMLGDETRAKLAALPPGAAHVILPGDDAAVGDGSADARIIYRSESAPLLGLRLRWNNARGQYDLLGFWTPQS